MLSEFFNLISLQAFVSQFIDYTLLTVVFLSLFALIYNIKESRKNKVESIKVLPHQN